MPGSWVDGAAGCAGVVLGRMGRRQELVYSQDGALCPPGRERLLVCVGISLNRQREAPFSPPCVWHGSEWCSNKCCDILLQSGGRFHPWTHQSLALMPGGPFSQILTCCQPRDGAACGALLLKIISIKGPLGHSAPLPHAVGKDVVLHCF